MVQQGDFLMRKKIVSNNRKQSAPKKQDEMLSNQKASKSRGTHLLKRSEIQKVVQSAQRSVEEKITQMSQIRLVAEVMSSGLYMANYIDEVCKSMTEYFNALSCCYFEYIPGEKDGWLLTSWYGLKDVQKPEVDWIEANDEGILGWIRMFRRPSHRAKLSGDPFARFMGGEIYAESSGVFFPILEDGLTKGILVINDPQFNISKENINPHIVILNSLINTGFRNFFMYKDLSESEEEFRDLFESSSDMVVVAYPTGKIKDCNRAFLKNLRVAGDMRGWDIAAFVAEKSVRDFKDYWSKLNKGSAIRNKLIFLSGEGGSIIEADFSANPKLKQDGSVESLRLYFHDETKRREAERQRMELELELQYSHQRQLAQVGFYVSGIVHNLRNPVQIISGYIDMLHAKGYDLPELEKMKGGTNSMSDIIDNILTKLKKESNIEETEVNINDLLRCELEFLNANTFYKHETEKYFDFDENLPPVRGLYGDFSQAIMNIISNALDAISESRKKELRIATWYEREIDSVCISVSDSGPGIPRDLQERIFQPFFSTKIAESSVNGILSGTGLGLSNSVELIQHYGGKIRLNSKPKEGSTFIISIPVSKRTSK